MPDSSPGFPGATGGKEPACQRRRCKGLGFNHWVRKIMATHSSILAWRIPWTEEPGGLQSMGSHRVGYRVQPIAAALHFPSLVQCAMCSFSNPKCQLAFSRHPHTYVAFHKHLTYRPSSPTQRLMVNSGFPPWMPLFQSPFLQSPA